LVQDNIPSARQRGRVFPLAIWSGCAAHHSGWSARACKSRGAARSPQSAQAPIYCAPVSTVPRMVRSSKR